MKKNKYIGIITILKLTGIVLLVYISIKSYLKDKEDAFYRAYRFCKKRYNTEYKGVIIKNYSTTRAGRISILSDNTKFVWMYPIDVIKSKRWDSVEVWDPSIEVGDSIYKPKKSFDTYLYKKANPDSVMFFPYYEDCEVNIRANAKTPELKIKSTYRYAETQIISKVKLYWRFDARHEKLIKGFLIIRTNFDESIDTSALLSPQTRTYVVATNQNLYRQYF